MRLHEYNRQAKRREAQIRRKVEAEPVYERSTAYQPSAGSLIDCKGECGKVTPPFDRDGYCRGCYEQRERQP